MTSHSKDSNRRVGDYTLIKEIGRGGSSIVWQAEERAEGKKPRVVALKLLVPHSNQVGQDWKSRFDHETALLRKISQHPQLVSIVDSGVDQETTPWIAFELMQGDIHAMRTKGPDGMYAPLDARTVFRVAYHIGEALRALHERSEPILHMDVKPANILFSDEKGGRRFKLTDFGVSREEGATRTLNPETSARYSAPEVINRELGKVGPASDLYSLGIALLELLLGERAFRAQFASIWAPEELHRNNENEARAWVFWHTSSAHTIRPLREITKDVPADFCDIIDGLVKKDLSERTRSAIALLDRLRATGLAESALPRMVLDDRISILEQWHDEANHEKALMLAEIERLSQRLRHSRIAAAWLWTLVSLGTIASGLVFTVLFQGLRERDAKALAVVAPVEQRFNSGLEDARSQIQRLENVLGGKQDRLSAESLQAVDQAATLPGKFIELSASLTPLKERMRILELPVATTLPQDFDKLRTKVDGLERSNKGDVARLEKLIEAKQAKVNDAQLAALADWPSRANQLDQKIRALETSGKSSGSSSVPEGLEKRVNELAAQYSSIQSSLSGWVYDKTRVKIAQLGDGSGGVSTWSPSNKLLTNITYTEKYPGCGYIGCYTSTDVEGSPSARMYTIDDHGMMQLYRNKVLSTSMGSDADGGYLYAYDGSGEARASLAVDSAGSGYITVWGNGKSSSLRPGGDVAEMFPCKPGSRPLPGQVVGFHVGTDSARLEVVGADPGAIVVGVVSGHGDTVPSLVMGITGSENEVAVALVGQVEVHVNDLGGAIRPGDLLGVSPVVGQAMKIAGDGRATTVLGRALTAHSGGDGYVRMMVGTP